MSVMVPPSLSRRRLLTSGLAAGSLGLSGATLLGRGVRAAPVPPRDVLTGSHWGAFRATVEGGRMTAIRPWEKDPRPTGSCRG